MTGETVAVRTGSALPTLSKAERRRVTPEHYFKSAEDMRALFADLPEAVDNTLVIARRCAYMVPTRKPMRVPHTRGQVFAPRS